MYCDELILQSECRLHIEHFPTLCLIFQMFIDPFLGQGTYEKEK